MATAIINVIDIENSKIDYVGLNNKFDFYLIKNEGKNSKPSARLLDEPLLGEDVLAIQYTSGNSLILMMKKNVLNKSRVAKLITEYNAENAGNLTSKLLKAPFQDYPHSLLQVLFNSLAKSKFNEGASNLGGKLLYFADQTKSQIHCVQLKIDASYAILLNSVTLTKYELDKPSGKPEYILQSNNTMKYKTASDKSKKFYTIFQYDGTHYAVTDCNTASPAAFDTSKMGIFQKIMEKFERDYSDLIQLKIKTETDWNKLEVKSSETSKIEHLRNLKKLLNGQSIKIVDKISDGDSETFCNQLKTVYESLFSDERFFLKNDRDINFKIKFTKTPGKNDFNIMVIHHKDFYKDNPKDDPHNINYKEPIQHVTFEDFSRNEDKRKPEKLGLPSEAACLVVLNELIVKRDLNAVASGKGRLSIFDWTSLGFTKDWTFCYCKQVKKDDDTIENHYVFMVIHPDGSFEIGERSKDLFNQQLFEQIEEIFALNNMNAEIHNRYNEKYIGLVMNDKEEINIIQDTPFRMFADSGRIKEDLKKGPLSRSKESLEEYYRGCLDIYYKIIENELLYSVGQIGVGMQTKIERASHIRRVKSHNDSPLFFQELMETMNITFVRNGQLTVLPFPFKYLREYAKNL